MRYSQLKAFHHVALLGGFSRAAEALYLTQPAISEQVRKLEQEHDVLLFSRERKRVQLTPAGEELFRLTKQFFEIEAQIEEYMSETQSAVKGELRIMADAAHHVTHILHAFRQRHPDVTISLQVGNTDRIVEELRAYNAEIGVVGSVAPGQDLSVVDLGSTEIIAFAAQGFLPDNSSRLPIKALAEYPLVFREVGSKTRQKLVEQAAMQGVKLKPAITAEGREAVREVVASGAGIGFVSLAEYVEDVRFTPIRIADLNIRMNESLVHLAQRKEVRVIRAFMDVAADVLAKRSEPAGG